MYEFSTCFPRCDKPRRWTKPNLRMDSDMKEYFTIIHSTLNFQLWTLLSCFHPGDIEPMKWRGSGEVGGLIVNEMFSLYIFMIFMCACLSDARDWKHRIWIAAKGSSEKTCVNVSDFGWCAKSRTRNHSMKHITGFGSAVQFFMWI